MRQLWNHAAFLRANQLPVEFLARLFPDIGNTAAPVDVSVDHHFSLPYGERAVVAALVSHLRPRTVFEFGTFTGGTTRMMADLLPASSTIHTIDLPDEEMAWPVGGQDFRDPAYAERIVMHRAKTAAFDFEPFKSSVDFVFVDASHAYDDIVADSRFALEIVNAGGVVVWDDYQPRTMGVVTALNELSRKIQLVRIAYTRLVIFRQQPFPDIEATHREPWVDHPPRATPG